MQWFAKAPANIALIKYMGKTDTNLNLPGNPSLSYTLENLTSSVMIETQPGKKDFWEPLQIPGGLAFSLSKVAQERYLQHVIRLKDWFGYTGAFLVRSTNNFPHGNGLASSASSFAALTLCVIRALSELTQRPMPSMETQAQLSRLGSGSSCRSFFAPWALWQDDRVEAIDLPYKKLLHQVVLISHGEKLVPSSEAHERVKTSKDYETRSSRASRNLEELLDALRQESWQRAHNICWREFMDMHALFKSSTPAFTYITAETQTILDKLQDLWNRSGDGPLVTMDAGPNIHMLYRLDQTELAQQFHTDHLLGNYDVL